MLKFTLLFALIGFVALLTPLFAASPDSSHLGIERLKLLPAMGNEERIKFLDELSAEREQFGTVVERALIDAKTDDGRIAAAYVLGRYRMENSVPLLNQYLTLKAQLPQRRTKEGLWHEYPVVEALAKIGKPSVRFMIENLATSEDDLVRRLSTRVILAIEGDEIGKLRVKQAAEKAQGAKKQRLEESFPLFESEADRSWKPAPKSA